MFKTIRHKSQCFRSSCEQVQRNHLMLYSFVVWRTALETQTVTIGCIFHSVCCLLLPLSGLRYCCCCSNTVNLNFKVSHLPDPAAFANHAVVGRRSQEELAVIGALSSRQCIVSNLPKKALLLAQCWLVCLLQKPINLLIKRVHLRCTARSYYVFTEIKTGDANKLLYAVIFCHGHFIWPNGELFNWESEFVTICHFWQRLYILSCFQSKQTV